MGGLIINDMGTDLFPQYPGRWIPDSPAHRRAVVFSLSTWRAFSNSSPVEGITAAITAFYAPDKKISLYVFGDEFSGSRLQPVVEAIDRSTSLAGTAAAGSGYTPWGFRWSWKKPTRQATPVSGSPPSCASCANATAGRLPG